MSWSTQDEVIHIKGLPARANSMAQQYGVTPGQYIRAYSDSLKARQIWDGLDKGVVIYEMGRILGAVQKRTVT